MKKIDLRWTEGGAERFRRQLHHLGQFSIFRFMSAFMENKKIPKQKKKKTKNTTGLIFFFFSQ